VRAQHSRDAIQEYFAGLPDERARILRGLRKTILANLPAGFTEEFRNEVLTYVIPLSAYSDTYNGHPLLLAALASQKTFVTLYLMAVYGDRKLETWFKEAYTRSGKRLDMGRSCVHFKRAGDIPHGVIGKAIAKVSVKQYIRIYEAARRHRSKTWRVPESPPRKE
jgi:hypothetical protein